MGRPRPRHCGERGRKVKRGKSVRERGRQLRIGHAHPDYVIGQHWLSVAYDRICAGENEIEVMRDYGYAAQRDRRRCS